MPRARGANAVAALGFETVPGVPAAPNTYYRVAFASADLGEEQALIESELLGFGRDPQQPSRGPADASGSFTVPLDARLFGLWLKTLMGSPTTTTGLAAKGSFTATAQPANNATISAGGQDFTFVAGAPAANQIKIGASLLETLTNAVRALNASAVAGVAAATYRLGFRGNAIEVVHDALGTAGNSFALAASSSPASNITVSAPTLTGGAAAGAKHHTFVGGAQDLPSASIEIGHPEVPNYALNAYVMANTLGIQLQRTGQLNATIGLLAQGEYPATASVAGSLIELIIERFSQFSGSVLRDGVPIADLVSGQFNLSNGLDTVPGLRGDGRITGIDPGMLGVTGQVGVRFSTRDLLTIAENGTPIELEFRWAIPNTNWALTFVVHQVYLPKPKTAVEGPGGIVHTYAWQGSEHPTLHRTVTAVLVNDVAAYS